MSLNVHSIFVARKSMSRGIYVLAVAIITACLAPSTTNAFAATRQLRSVVDKAKDLSKQASGGERSVEDLIPQASHGGEASTKHSTTAFRARNIPTTPNEANKNEVTNGMSFTLREDPRCFVVEVDRPGDHAACTFHYRSNISDASIRSRVGRNVTVEWYGPNGASIAVFAFSPQHPCAAKGRCLVRATPIPTQNPNQGLHGVVSGAYSLCFRMSSPSMLAKIIQAFSSHRPESHEELQVELLELSTESLLPPSGMRDAVGSIQSENKVNALRGNKKGTRVVGAGSQPTSVNEGKRSPPAATQHRLSSIENRVRLLNAEVESIVREAAYSEERQGSFEALANALFTRIWICGVGTIAATLFVLWAQTVVLRRHLVKKKIV